MKKVLADMKAKSSVRANKDWDLAEKVSREGREIIKQMVENLPSLPSTENILVTTLV